MSPRTQFILSGITISLIIVLMGIINFGGFYWLSVRQEKSQLRLDEIQANEVAVYQAQISFKVQIQEWKNVLLRGHKKADFEKYFRQFETRETEVFENLESLIASEILSDRERALARNVLDMLKANGYRYRAALDEIAIAEPLNAFLLDTSVRGIDRAPMNLLNDLSEQIIRRGRIAREEVRGNMNAMVRSFIIISGICLVAGIAVTVTFLVDRRRFERELSGAKHDADRANRAKSNFLAHMSHEIRTPMNGITAAVDLLKATELPPELEESVEVMESSTESLIVIVNDILDISRIEAGKMKLDPVRLDLNHFLQVLKKTIQPVAAQKTLDICFDWPTDPALFIKVDPIRLRQVLLNFLSNAIKFTNEGSVTLEVTELESKGDHVRLEFAVKDTGIGIAPEKQDLLFKAFSQVDNSATRRHHGTGLGLVICKAIVQSMGGQVGFSSSLGKGSTFFFTIEAPSERIDSPEETFQTNNAIPLVTRELNSILLVDDVATNRLVAIRLLQKLGLHADTAVNGRNALEAVQKKDYDLILMDCQMPEMDGYEATRCIRQLPITQPVIIAMTAHAMEEHRKESAEAGMDDHLAKPIRLKNLQSCISDYFHLESVPAIPKRETQSVG